MTGFNDNHDDAKSFLPIQVKPFKKGILSLWKIYEMDLIATARPLLSEEAVESPLGSHMVSRTALFMDENTEMRFSAKLSVRLAQLT